MKKKTLILMGLCLALCLALAGCGSSNPYSKYDLSEYVKVGNYTGLEREPIKVSVSDEEVQSRVESNVENTATTEQVKTGKVAKDDTVNIDYEGKIGGKTFSGGSQKGASLTIGSGQFIDGFEDGLIGKEVGSTQDLKLKFPDDYNNASVAGKDVIFTVKINYIEKKAVPEYNDEWVTKNSKVKNTAEYDALMKEEIQQEKEESAKTNQVNELWQQVMDSSKVLQYPEDEVKAYMQVVEDQYMMMAQNYGMDLETLREQQGLSDDKAYNEQRKEIAQDFIKQRMILYYIAEKEDLDYSKEDEEKLRQDIEEAGLTEESFKETYGQEIDEYVQDMLTFNAVGDFIFDRAKEVEKKTDATKATEATEAEQAGDEENADDAADTQSNDHDAGADDATSNDEPGGADA